MDLSRFSQQVTEAVDGEARALPPVDKWDPPFCGDMDMVIRLDGTWHYQNSPIGRPALVKLFSSVLKKEQDQYYLVTPVEKVGIQVEDVPFIVTQWEAEDDGIVFTTNVGERFTLSSNHPLELRMPPDALKAPDTTPIPYVCVRTNLWARLHQNVYYQLIEQAERRSHDGVHQLYLTSEYEPFVIGEIASE